MKPFILLISLCVNFSALEAVAQNIQLKEDGKAHEGVEQNHVSAGQVTGHVDAGNNGGNVRIVFLFLLIVGNSYYCGRGSNGGCDSP